MEILKYILITVGSYLLGSVSMSIIMSKTVLGGDVRDKGSGNAGATNMARVFGWGAGFLTLAGDVAKAALAMYLGWLLMGDTGLALGGIASTLGHCFPVFYGFKGGKGVSVGLAVAFAVNWRVAAIALSIFIIIAVCTKKVSLGSICAAASIIVCSIVMSVGVPKMILGITVPSIVIIQHRGNIRRLIDGTEKDFKAGKRPEKTGK